MQTPHLELAKRENLSIAIALINQAKEYLKEQGINQWQTGYPDAECIEADIENDKGYLLIHTGKIIGYMCIDFDGEPAYETLKGEWKSKRNYAVVHRMAIDSSFRGKGIAITTFELIENLCKTKEIFSIRVDTDQANTKMQHILKKSEFEYCGRIWFQNSEKIAFEKLID